MAQPHPLPPSLYHEFFDLVTTARTREEWQSFLAGSLAGDPEPLAMWAREVMMPCGDPAPRVADWIAENVSAHRGVWQAARGLGVRAKGKDLIFKAKSALKGRGERRLASDDLSQTQAGAAVTAWRTLAQA